MNGNLLDQGQFEGGISNGNLCLAGSGIYDFSQGTLSNTDSISVTAGSNSLVILPRGFNPSTGFRSYATSGLTYVLGSTLTIPAGRTLSGSLTINDPVSCQGTILATSASFINLNNGLTLSGTGFVNLGSGSLTINDVASGMSGGQLIVPNQYVGSSGNGVFGQTGGTNTVSQRLYLGYNSGNCGTYTLGGNGLLTASWEYAGYSGTGALSSPAEAIS